MWHGGAHHIGYDVHDMIKRPEIIAPNMVFCVDIGVYHEEWGIGFRLEDNCLVTENGCENLSAAIRYNRRDRSRYARSVTDGAGNSLDLSAGALLGGLDLLFGSWIVSVWESISKRASPLLGPTALSMVGILCFAPLLSRALEGTAAPLFLRIGLDPALLGGICNRYGRLSNRLFAGAAAGGNGRVAGIRRLHARLAVTFTIPMGTGIIPKEALNDFFAAS